MELITDQRHPHWRRFSPLRGRDGSHRPMHTGLHQPTGIPHSWRVHPKHHHTITITHELQPVPALTHRPTRRSQRQPIPGEHGEPAADRSFTTKNCENPKLPVRTTKFTPGATSPNTATSPITMGSGRSPGHQSSSRAGPSSTAARNPEPPADTVTSATAARGARPSAVRTKPGSTSNPASITTDPNRNGRHLGLQHPIRPSHHPPGLRSQ